jgi:hypothetical protein
VHTLTGRLTTRRQIIFIPWCNVMASNKITGSNAGGAMIHPGGMTDGSRGLSAATPPDPTLNDEMHPGRGARGRADTWSGRSRRCLAPCQGADPIPPQSGGIAALNPRLPAGNPPGWAASVRWANKADATNAVMACRFHSEPHGRGVGDLQNSS